MRWVLRASQSTLRCDGEKHGGGGSKFLNLARRRTRSSSERRRQRYLGGRQRAEVSGRTAIVIDDDIATGATIRAALRATRMRSPKKLGSLLWGQRVRLPSCAARLTTSPALRITTDLFGAIGAYYADFRQVSDGEVIDILERSPLQSL